MTQFFKLVAELGLPIAATAGMGVFIVFIIKYILNGIVNSMIGFKLNSGIVK